MAIISEETINNIVRQNDIVDVISEYISLTPKGKNYFGICPFHDDHSPSMSVSKERQVYTCFVCKAHGNVITFIMNYLSVPYLEAIKILADRVGISVDITSSIKKEDKYTEEYNIYDTALKYYKNNLNTKYGEKAKEYLIKRGLSIDTINTFDLGVSFDTKDGLTKILQKKYSLEKIVKSGLVSTYQDQIYDIYKDRIMFPIKDSEGRNVAFSGRIYFTKNDSKYINSKESNIFKKSNILYNYHNAKEEIRKKKEIIICEGFMDVIRLSTIGIKNAVALMGTSFTNEHLELIKNMHVSVTLSLDNDEAGVNATLSIGETLTSNEIPCNVIIFDKYKDVDEYILNNSAESFIKCLNNKISFIDFKLEKLKRSKNLNNSEEFASFINASIDAINKIDDEILKEIKIKELSKTYDIDESIIRSKITNTKINKVIKNKPLKKEIIRYNKYQISEFRIIYLMLNHDEVIRIYENRLGHLINDNMKRLANEIVYYKDKNNGFNLSLFMNYLMDKEELNNALNEVLNYNNEENYSEEEIEDYISTIEEGTYKKEVEKLKQKMKETLDINEKTKIAKKIESMKKEVLKW